MLGALKLPIYRSSLALMLTTGANAVLGLAFWVAAARLFPPDVVGLGAGGISALQLVAGIGWLGLQFTLLRYVPVAGPSRRRLVGAVYAVGGAASLAVAVVFTAAFADDLRVGYVADGAFPILVFWVSVLVWTVFSLQDSVLVGIRRSFLVPAENAVYGLLKLVLLVALAGIDDPWVLLGVWSGGTAVLVAGINGVLFRRMLAEDAGDTVRLPPRRRIARFSSGQTAVGLVAWVPDFLVPLLVLRYAGDAANAYYYAAWTVGFSSRLLAMNLANALTAEGAYGENSMRDLVRSVGRLGVLVLLPVMVVLIAGAGLVLRVFGADYSEEAAPLLRLFAIGLVPFCIATIVIAYERVLERFAAALAVNVVGTATTLGLDVLLIPSHGITGAGWGWLGGQVAAAVVALATLAGGRVARGPAHPVTASRGDLGQSPAP